MEWSRAKTNRVLLTKHTGHSKHLFQQHKRQLYTWTSPDGQYWNQTDYIFCSRRWRSSIQSGKTRPGADCGKLMNTLLQNSDLKKVGKTARSFRYDLNQIPYDYAVKVRNRFNGLDLIDRMPDEPWTEVYDIVQETGINTIPKKRNAKRQNGCLRKLYN